MPLSSSRPLVSEMTRAFTVLESEVALEQRLAAAVTQAQQHLLGLQKPEGYWMAELIVDATLTCDHIIFMHWQGEVDFICQAKCVKHILQNQLPDGGWNIYPGGPSELNATVKAYLVLKLAGFTADEPELRRAQATVLRLGGIPKCNTYTKLYLALIGLWPWEHLPIIPAEVLLLPNWFYFNIYEMSAWSRTMLVPLTIINHFKPTRRLPEEKQLHELFPYGTEHTHFRPPWSKKLISWQNFFLVWDRLLKFLDRLPWRPFRQKALRKAELWLLERNQAGCDGLGAIQPAMIYNIIAMSCLGYAREDPISKKALQDYLALHIDDQAHGDYRIQPCFSPVWDTAITAVCLADSGIPADAPALQKGAAWLLEKEVRHVRGDWHVKNPHPENSGWAFEFNNNFYPDVDDTWKVLLALSCIRTPDEAAKEAAMQRGLRWAISFQCRNGGWAAFDKDVTKKWLQDVPFADHNAILDPPCSDITARGLEVFGRLGLKRPEPFIRRGIKFIRDTQEEDGSWQGRWGVNYLYGTWLVLRGLWFIGEDMNQDWILRGRDWLESCQNEDGGWGETPASYENSSLKGCGPSTASQTAWAVNGITACGDVLRPSARRGVTYLCRLQNADGSWTEDYLTGTGFPKVFYLKYDLYRNNWPLLALADYRRMMTKQQERSAAWAQSTLAMAELRTQHRR
jgi:squalene-hopene/tetraprenyl-beta-curcumene cyclase